MTARSNRAAVRRAGDHREALLVRLRTGRFRMRAAHEPPNSQRDDCAADHEDDEPEQGSPLTVKLRGRTEAPQGAEGTQFLSARGA
jgi:hypothetical protein